MDAVPVAAPDAGGSSAGSSGVCARDGFDTSTVATVSEAGSEEEVRDAGKVEVEVAAAEQSLASPVTQEAPTAILSLAEQEEARRAAEEASRDAAAAEEESGVVDLGGCDQACCDDFVRSALADPRPSAEVVRLSSWVAASSRGSCIPTTCPRSSCPLCLPSATSMTAQLLLGKALAARTSSSTMPARTCGARLSEGEMTSLLRPLPSESGDAFVGRRV